MNEMLITMDAIGLSQCHSVFNTKRQMTSLHPLDQNSLLHSWIKTLNTCWCLILKFKTFFVHAKCCV